MKNSYCLTFCIALMKYTGVWLPDGLNHKWKIIYIIFAVLFQMFFFFLMVLAEIAYVFKVTGNTELTVDAAVLLLSHLVQGVKVLNICCRQNRIKRLITMIDGKKFINSDPFKRSIVEKATRRAAFMGLFVISTASVTALFWVIVPTLKTELTLPLKTAFPFNFSQNPMFGITYAYTSISVSIVGVGDAAENYLVAGMMIMACIQLEVLCLELAEIGTRKEGKNTCYEETVLCIKHHQNIIEYVEELADIFSLPIFCQFVMSSAVVCMTIFKITITTEPVEFMTIIFYLTCVFIELLMYCYPGDLLINKSLLVSEAAYPNDWDGDICSRRALLLTALRAQRALAVTAGGVFKVCLPTAATIVQTSYSYYAVLRQKAKI